MPLIWANSWMWRVSAFQHWFCLSGTGGHLGQPCPLPSPILPLLPPLSWSYEVVCILLREPSLDCLHAICHHIVCLNPWDIFFSPEINKTVAASLAIYIWFTLNVLRRKAPCLHLRYVSWTVCLYRIPKSWFCSLRAAVVLQPWALASPETCVKYSAAREACILCGSTLISSCQDEAYKEQWLVHGAGWRQCVLLAVSHHSSLSSLVEDLIWKGKAV